MLGHANQTGDNVRVSIEEKKTLFGFYGENGDNRTLAFEAWRLAKPLLLPRIIKKHSGGK